MNYIIFLVGCILYAQVNYTAMHILVFPILKLLLQNGKTLVMGSVTLTKSSIILRESPDIGVSK